MKKYVLPILVTCFAVLLTGCTKPSPVPSTFTSNSGSIAAYAQIVAVAKPATGAGTAGSCVDCHTSTGTASTWPWADPNSQIAYNSGSSIGIVNVSAPLNSPLLTYLTNKHCGSAQCEVTSGSAVYNTFVTAAQNYAQATLSSGATTSPSPSPSATPSPSSTLVAVSALGGLSASPVPLPSNPPLLGDSPLILNVPLTAANASAGTSSLQLSVAYTVAGTNSKGGVEYLYDLSNPVLVNPTTTVSVTVSGFYIALNGMADLGNNIFSNPNLYYATAAPGKTQTLIPTGSLDSISLLASPGDTLTLVIVKLTTGPP